MKTVGIYSGTFDPIHSGHLAFAQASIDEMSLDVLYLLPEETPRRKTDVTSLSHRQAMLELAVKGIPNIKTVLPGMSDQHNVASTLSAFMKQHPKDKLVILMGADVFLNIDKWANYKELIKKVEFAVALRTEDDGEELVYKLQELPDAKVTKFVTDKATVTSSKIRNQSLNGEEPQNIDPRVLEYINENKIYYSSLNIG